MSSSTTTSTSSTVPNGNGDNFEPVSDRASRLDVDAFEREYISEWKELIDGLSSRDCAIFPNPSHSKLYDESVEMAEELFSSHKDYRSDDPIMDGLHLEVESKFKGSIKAEDKKRLKREYFTLSFGNYMASKKLKLNDAARSAVVSFFQKHNGMLMREIRLSNAYVQKLKHENQSLCTTYHQMINSNQRTVDDLRMQALISMAGKYCTKQKVGSAIFNQYGFAISKALLTKDVKCIRKANDFGPNSVKGGRQFFKGFFKELSKSPADCRCDELTQIKNSEMVYNDSINRTVADDQMNIYTGHPLDTKENRLLIWYGTSDVANDGIVSIIIKAFNGKRSDESSKKIRPVLGTFIFLLLYITIFYSYRISRILLVLVGATLLSSVASNVPPHAGLSHEDRSLLSSLKSIISNPRGNKTVCESALKSVYAVLSLLMNPNLKSDRVKLFVDQDGNDLFGTLTARSNPIVGLNYKGKAKLHMCSVSDSLTTAQEAWIILHLARCYYFHVEGVTGKNADCPVSPQSLNPKLGSANTYSQKDVDFFRSLFKKIDAHRKEEKTKVVNGDMEKSERFCYWNFPEEVLCVNRDDLEGDKSVSEDASTAVETGDVAVASEIDDDSLVGDDGEMEF